MKGSILIPLNVIGPQEGMKHWCAQQNKPDTNGDILHDSTYRRGHQQIESAWEEQGKS